MEVLRAVDAKVPPEGREVMAMFLHFGVSHQESPFAESRNAATIAAPKTGRGSICHHIRFASLCHSSERSPSTSSAASKAASAALAIVERAPPDVHGVSPTDPTGSQSVTARSSQVSSLMLAATM